MVECPSSFARWPLGRSPRSRGAVGQAGLLSWYDEAMAELDVAVAGLPPLGPPGGHYANELFTAGRGALWVYRGLLSDDTFAIFRRAKLVLDAIAPPPSTPPTDTEHSSRTWNSRTPRATRCAPPSGRLSSAGRRHPPADPRHPPLDSLAASARKPAPTEDRTASAPSVQNPSTRTP